MREILFDCESGDGMKLRVADIYPKAGGVTFEVYDPAREDVDYDVWLNLADAERLVEFLQGCVRNQGGCEGVK